MGVIRNETMKKCDDRKMATGLVMRMIANGWVICTGIPNKGECEEDELYIGTIIKWDDDYEETKKTLRAINVAYGFPAETNVPD